MKKYTVLLLIFALILTSACGNVQDNMNIISTAVTSTPTTFSITPQETAVLTESYNGNNSFADFEDVETIGYEWVDLEISSIETEINDDKINTEILNSAIEAYRSSDYFDLAVENAKNEYALINKQINEASQENGMSNYVLSIYESFQNEKSADEYDFYPQLYAYYSFPFDSKNEETILILETPYSERQSSLYYTTYIPMYVNTDGEAFILDDAVTAAPYEVSLIQFADGTLHFVMYNHHSEGTRKTSVYSVKNGKPALKMSTSVFVGFAGKFFQTYYNWGAAPTLYYWNPTAEEYCLINGEYPDEEFAQLLCNDDNILKYVPNVWEEYQNGNVYIVGGKYIAFTQGITFKYDGNKFIKEE